MRSFGHVLAGNHTWPAGRPARKIGMEYRSKRSHLSSAVLLILSLVLGQEDLLYVITSPFSIF